MTFISKLQIGLPVLMIAALVEPVSSHGHLVSPRSRNYLANQEGIDWGSQPEVPPREYCPHCLNTNKGVCGVSTDYDYDEWMDSANQPMPWVSQSTYVAGDIIRVKSHLEVHHNGHMEIRGCPDGGASIQDCFDDPKNTLLFVKDTLHGMPADPVYPERGYYAGGVASGFTDFDMEFQLPQSLVGSNVLLQVRLQTVFCRFF